MAVADSAKPSRRQSLGLWARVIVSAVLLAVLVSKIHPEDLLPERRQLSTIAFLFAGQFVGNVLPSTVGGDVVRVSRTATTTGSGSVAFASVVLERLTGFVVLPLLVFLGFLFRPSLLDNNHAWIALAIGCGTLLLLGVILLVTGHPRLAGRFAERENWMRFIGAVHVGIDRLRHRHRDSLPAVDRCRVVLRRPRT